MDTRTGRVVYVPPGQAAPHGSVPLTRRETEEYRHTTNRARLRRWKKAHAEDDCRSCGKKLRDHTLRQFQTCYSE
ncbi:MAG TPA: hypothetical protein VF708_19865 [Pyrinomonadaceae bacterium]